MKVKYKVGVFSASLLTVSVLSLSGALRTAYRYFSRSSTTASPFGDVLAKVRTRIAKGRQMADDRCLTTDNSGMLNETLAENMTSQEADDIYFRFVFQQHFRCKLHGRFGKPGDGGWDVCLTRPFRPTVPCLVYSFGINYDFSFDDDISKKCGCLVRSFDYSMERAKDHRRSRNIWFYKIGLGGKDTVLKNGWKLKTLHTIMKEMNDTKKIIDYLKFDIENHEWDVLQAMYTTDILMQVKQLGLEIHAPERKKSPASAFYMRWRILKHLEDLGFRRWYFHLNRKGFYKMKGKTRSCCYEMVYINKRFIPGNRCDTPNH